MKSCAKIVSPIKSKWNAILSLANLQRSLQYNTNTNGTQTSGMRKVMNTIYNSREYHDDEIILIQMFWSPNIQHK